MQILQDTQMPFQDSSAIACWADCSRLINHGKTISIIAQILRSVTVCRMRSFSPRYQTRALEHWHILKWFLV